MTTRPQWEKRRVLVTGGAGFIGSELTRTLVRLGAEVAVIDDLSTGRMSNLDLLEQRVEFVKVSILDRKTCRRMCNGRSIVFHLAALGSVPRSMKYPAKSIGVNVSGTANIFEACRDGGVDRVIFASSSSVYGDNIEPQRREGEEGFPLSPYALSKLASEQIASAFSRYFDMETIGLRYFNVFGPNQRADTEYAAVIPRFLSAALKSEDLVVNGSGLQTRDFTYVTDAVEATLLAAIAPKEACTTSYNVGAGGSTSVLDLAEIIIKATGSTSRILHGPARPGDVDAATADLSRCRALLGYRPRVELEAGIGQILEQLEI